MRIVLINPPSLFAYGKINTGHNCSFPLGLGYLASYVRQFGHQVALFDPEASRSPFERMWEQIDAFSPDLVGLTSVTTNFTVASHLVDEAKHRLRCYVIMGGPHVTALPSTSLQAAPGLDAVIRGEGEIPLKIIAEQFDRHGKVDFRTVPGATFYQDGSFQETPRPQPIEDLDLIPFPARDLVDLSWYRLHAHFQRGKRSATILFSRGCPSKCTFCANVVTGRRVRTASPQYFVDELEMLVNEQGIRHFHIVDDCFTADMGKVGQICDLIIAKQLPVTWFCFGRVDTLRDEQVARKMKKAGCVYILLGVESGNQRILDIMKKGTTLDMIEECCAVLRKVGIHYFNSFIIGNEGDTMDTVEETIDFSKRLRSVMAGFNILIPFPGTAIFGRYYREMDRPDTDWSSFCSVGDDVPYEPHHTELSKRDILHLTAQAYKRYYSSIGQLMRILGFVKNPRIFLSYIRGAYGLGRQVLSWNRKTS